MTYCHKLAKHFAIARSVQGREGILVFEDTKHIPNIHKTTAVSFMNTVAQAVVAAI